MWWLGSTWNGSSVIWYLQLLQLFSSLLGLVQKQHKQVKLHVTLMNTLFRSDEADAETPRGRHKPRETFDATSILKVCRFETRVIFMLACSDLVVCSRNC